MQNQNIGFLGAGNMAGAMIKALLNAAVVSPERIMASDVRDDRLDDLHRTYGVMTTMDNAEVVQHADLLVLAVKPQVVDKVLPAMAEHMRPETVTISIVAGVRLAALEARLPAGTRLVRAMPNTPAMVLAGATAIAAGTHASPEDMRQAKSLFNMLGKTVVLDENLLDAVTGLSGSGPAYVMLMIEALADGGVKVGLHRETALLLAAQTVYGSAKLLLDSGEHPGRLKDMVTSPGGTAIAGLHTLEAGGLRRTLMDAVENATKRGEELGEQLDRKLAPNGKG
ncbi:MAG: pyrroline-5-carboxylate reductase [Deltaproteobacteria bacterium]|nr:pyrroline-5-carboxylate reductase [Deltaproteobacteria bacterium]